MHAVNLLNFEDGGRRRCICITNNEVSDVEAKKLQAEGYRPGDNEWLELGIARYVMMAENKMFYYGSGC